MARPGGRAPKIPEPVVVHEEALQAQRVRLTILRNTQAVLLLGLAALIIAETFLDIPESLTRALISTGVVVWGVVYLLIVRAEIIALRAAGARWGEALRSALFGTQVRLITGAPLVVFLPALAVAAAVVVQILAT